MKAIVKKYNASEKRALSHAVDMACLESAKSFEILDDICFMYAVCEEYKLGVKRAKRLYTKYWELRHQIQEYVRADGESNTIEDGLRESLMEDRLKRKGITIREWKENIGSERFGAEIK